MTYYLPTLSIVVCTRNRARQLRSALEAIGQLEYDGRWELHVVDNGSSDDTVALVKAFARQTMVRVVLSHAPRPGLSRARNIGLVAAAGDIVAFLDDDCYPAPDYLTAVAGVFGEAAIGFCGGRLLLFDPADQRITLQESQSFEVLPPGAFIRSGRIHGANMAFRRQALVDIRGFDERLGAGTFFKAAEDSDAQRRLSLAGWRGVYDPAIVVYHHHGRQHPADVDVLLRAYDRGIGAAMIKRLCDARSRQTYARGWWWKLREIGWGRAWRQLAWGLLFAARYGWRPRALRDHPAAPFPNA